MICGEISNTSEVIVKNGGHSRRNDNCYRLRDNWSESKFICAVNVNSFAEWSHVALQCDNEAQVHFIFSHLLLLQFLVAISPLLALAYVLFSAFEDPNDEALKRRKKGDFELEGHGE